MTVVFDTSAMVEAIFWPRRTARRALSGLARRKFRLVLSTPIIEEYKNVLSELRSQLFPKSSPSGALAWVVTRAVLVEPTALRRRISRDLHDDVFVATALAAHADCIVTQDRDLLVLEKPYGIQMMTPVELVRKLRL